MIERYWRSFVDNNWERIASRFGLSEQDKPLTEDAARTLYLRWCDEIGAE